MADPYTTNPDGSITFGAAGGGPQGGQFSGLAPAENPPTEQELRPKFNTGVNPWTEYFAQRAFGNSNLDLPGLNTVNQDQARLEQQRVIQALQEQAAGNYNSQAQRQLQQGFRQAGAQQRALGSSIRGVGGGAGLRGGLTAAADVQRGFAGQREMLKLQEQQAAQAMLAQLLAQQNMQDVDLAGNLASADLNNRRLNQEMEQFYTQGYLGALGSNYQRNFDAERAKLGLDLEAQAAEARRNTQIAQGAATGLATLGSMLEKEDKKKGDD